MELTKMAESQKSVSEEIQNLKCQLELKRREKQQIDDEIEKSEIIHQRIRRESDAEGEEVTRIFKKGMQEIKDDRKRGKFIGERRIIELLQLIERDDEQWEERWAQAEMVKSQISKKSVHSRTIAEEISKLQREIRNLEDKLRNLEDKLRFEERRREIEEKWRREKETQNERKIKRDASVEKEKEREVKRDVFPVSAVVKKEAQRWLKIEKCAFREEKGLVSVVVKEERPLEKKAGNSEEEISKPQFKPFPHKQLEEKPALENTTSRLKGVIENVSVRAEQNGRYNCCQLFESRELEITSPSKRKNRGRRSADAGATQEKDSTVTSEVKSKVTSDFKRKLHKEEIPVLNPREKGKVKDGVKEQEEPKRTSGGSDTEKPRYTIEESDDSVTLPITDTKATAFERGQGNDMFISDFWTIIEKESEEIMAGEVQCFQKPNIVSERNNSLKGVQSLDPHNYSCQSFVNKEHKPQDFSSEVDMADRFKEKGELKKPLASKDVLLSASLEEITPAGVMDKCKEVSRIERSSKLQVGKNLVQAEMTRNQAIGKLECDQIEAEEISSLQLTNDQTREEIRREEEELVEKEMWERRETKGDASDDETESTSAVVREEDSREVMKKNGTPKSLEDVEFDFCSPAAMKFPVCVVELRASVAVVHTEKTFERTVPQYDGNCIERSKAHEQLLRRNGEEYVSPSCSILMLQDEAIVGTGQQEIALERIANDDTELTSIRTVEQTSIEGQEVENRIEKGANPSGREKLKIFQPVPEEPETSRCCKVTQSSSVCCSHDDADNIKLLSEGTKSLSMQKKMVITAVKTETSGPAAAKELNPEVKASSESEPGVVKVDTESSEDSADCSSVPDVPVWMLESSESTYADINTVSVTSVGHFVKDDHREPCVVGSPLPELYQSVPVEVPASVAVEVWRLHPVAVGSDIALQRLIRRRRRKTKNTIPSSHQHVIKGQEKQKTYGQPVRWETVPQRHWRDTKRRRIKPERQKRSGCEKKHRDHQEETLMRTVCLLQPKLCLSHELLDRETHMSNKVSDVIHLTVKDYDEREGKKFHDNILKPFHYKSDFVFREDLMAIYCIFNCSWKRLLEKAQGFLV